MQWLKQILATSSRVRRLLCGCRGVSMSECINWIENSSVRHINGMSLMREEQCVVSLCKTLILFFVLVQQMETSEHG